MEAELERVEGLTGSKLVAAAYLVTMPLYQEQAAIRRLTNRVGPIGSLPPVETIEDAMAIAKGDYPLSPEETSLLRALLLVNPDAS